MKQLMVVLALMPAVLLAEGIKLLAPSEGATVPILNAEQKAFLDKPRAERIAFMAEKANRKPMTKWGYVPVKTVLKWQALEPATAKADYRVKVVCAETGKTAFEGKTRATEIAVDNLEIARTYKWTVSCPLAGGEKSGSGMFKTEDRAPRLVRLDGVPNMRDLGGRIGLGGRRVKQGLVYRSSGFNNNACKFYDKEDVLKMYEDGTLLEKVPELSRKEATSIKKCLDAGKPEKANVTRLVKEWCPGTDRMNDKTRAFAKAQFGIKTDIDLRSPREVYGMKGSPLGPEVVWTNITSYAYGPFGREKGRAAFREVFKVFLDPANYPIAFHCIAGADRTGSVAATLLGLLGVDDDEIYRDWEATAFHNANPKFCHEQYFNHLIDDVFAKYPGATLAEKSVAHVKSLGFTDDDIAKFREIMFEK